MSTLNLLLMATEAVLASLVLPFLAALLARAYPNSAGRRSLVWATMFAILLALPLAAFLPTLAVITLPAAPLATVPAATVETVEPAFGGAVSAIALALTAWGLGALWIVVRGLAGMCWLERLCFRSAPLPPARLPLPLPRGCRVRLSPDRMGPMTWGAVRPVILLPDDALDWPRERLEAALRHELAHMARKDSLIQALALLACALYWPNPLVWRAAAALRREAETAADDAVIAAGVRPSDYAGLLVELAGEWPSRRQVSFEMAMAAPPILTERVQSILSPDAMRTGATAMDTFKLALMGGAALAALALARPSVAETPAPAAGPTFTATPAGPILTPAPAAQPAQHVEMRPMVVAQAAPKPAKPQDIQVSPAPPVPAAAPAAPAAPAASAGVSMVFPDGDHAKPRANVFYRDFGDQDGKLTPEQRAELNRQLAMIGPTIRKALADAHVGETVARALKNAHIDETVAQALKEAQPRIDKAIADAHVQELVNQRLADIQPQIDAALARSREVGDQAHTRALERAQERLAEAQQRVQERAKRAEERAREREEAAKAAHP